MSQDEDLLAALPDPPPPRPDRRKLAIGEALRRFDAGDGRSAPQRSAPARLPVRTFLARPQVAAFATLLLVALVSIPVWLTGVGRQAHRLLPETPPMAAHSGPAAAPNTSVVPTPPPDASAAPVVVAPPTAQSEGVVAPPPAPAMEASTDARRAEAPSPPAAEIPLADAPAASAAAAKADRKDQRLAPAPPPPPSPQAADATADAGSAIIVTGARAARPFGRDENRANTPIVRLPPTDDAWNACTVLDPRENLRACREMLDPGQPGAAGRAAAYIADGLSAAWKGDLDRAIKAFDRAIATAPRGSLAYLNRGLAYQLEGKTDQAIVDFTQAIAWDPASASAYYHRSLLLRAKGETTRADADAARARQLDPQNAAVLGRPSGN